MNKPYEPAKSFIRVATACPEVAVGDIATNITRIAAIYSVATKQNVSLVVFPEMALTGYTLGDLVQQQTILLNIESGLMRLAEQTSGTATVMIVGLPLTVGRALYNCAAVLSGGQIRGIVPKINLPNYKEFYEKRWFEAWGDQEN